MTDNVNHPAHYETGKFECIEVFFTAFISGSLKVRRNHNAISRKTGVGTALEPVPS